MSIRSKYIEAQSKRPKKGGTVKLKSTKGKTQMVLVVRDKDGNPKFSDNFPEDMKQKVLERLNDDRN